MCTQTKLFDNHYKTTLIKIIKKYMNSIFFIILSSQIFYIMIHLQFLLGIPQASLSVTDSLFMFLLGLLSYCLSNGSKKRYFFILWLCTFAIFEMQYFYISIFEKPFLLSEMKNYVTLIQVSSWFERILYLGSFGFWCIGVIYIIGINIKELILQKKYRISKIILISIISIIIYHTLNKTIPMPDWLGNYTQTFFMKGIIQTIQTREINTEQIISEEEVKKSFLLLKQLELKRKEFPISNSPLTAPLIKKPIIMITFESFYDYYDFYKLFGKENPFPKEYLNLIMENTYTGPNQTHGSFLSRFIQLTGSAIITSLNENRQHSYTLPAELKKYGYTTYALESVTPTYGLEKHYKNWGFNYDQYEIFGDDWSGKRLDPYLFEEKVSKIIQDTPSNIIPFYYGFTFLGHAGTTKFTDKLEDPENI
ncbi:MAG: hypothetical protein ACRCV0_04090, partial [Brevinema sp.]